MKRIVVLITIVLSFTILPSPYSWGQEAFEGLKVIPAPPSTTEVRKQKMQLMGNNFDTTIYASKLSFKKVADFYNKSLTNNEWQNLFSAKDIKSYMGSNIPSNQLIFRKGEEMITISYLPTSALAGETRFSLSRGKMSFPENKEEQESAAEIMGAIDIPVYPNAKPIPFSFDFSGNTPVGYVTSDSGEAILQFYRNEMLLHRWELDEEMPLSLQEINSQNLEKISQYKQLPPLTIEQMKNFSMKMGYLAFKKGRRTCMVGVTEILDPDFSESKTIISIVYSN